MRDEVTRGYRLSASVSLAGFAMSLAVVLSGALLLWLSAETIRSLHGMWLGYYYSHGYLVLVLTAVLVFFEVRRAPLAPRVPSWAGFAFLVFLLAIAFVCWATSIQSVSQLIWPFSMIATIWALSGLSNARRLVLPVAFLCVAIPIWDVLIAPLQALTIRVVTSWIHMASLPAFIEGNLIHVPSGTFEIAEGCGGLRYALVALALAYFSGALHHNRWKPTALLILLALVLAMIGNWIRVFATVAVGLAPPTGLASVIVRNYHTPFGWALFVLIMVPFFYVERRYQPDTVPLSPPSGSNPGEAMPMNGLNKKVIAYVCCVILALGAWLAHEANRSVPVSTASTLSQWPRIAGWQSAAEWQDLATAPKLFGADLAGGSWYSDGTTRVGVFVASYARQGEEREVFSSNNRPAGAGLVLEQRAVLDGSTLPFEELEVVDSESAHRLVWVGYRIAGRFTTSRLTAKALQLLGVLERRRDAQALVLTASCDEEGCDRARASLSQFASVGAEAFFRQAAAFAAPAKLTSTD